MIDITNNAKNEIENSSEIKESSKINGIFDESIQCLCCGKKKTIKNFYDSCSLLYRGRRKLPYCKNCLEKIFEENVAFFKSMGVAIPEKIAIKKMWMTFDLYYSESFFDKAYKKFQEKSTLGEPFSLVSNIMRNANLTPYRRKTYLDTLKEEYEQNGGDINYDPMTIDLHKQVDDKEKIETINRFGKGFTDEEYAYLAVQYKDWVEREGCQTKAQEEIYKQICFMQLKIAKANQHGEDTKDLLTTLNKMLDSAKLLPKQNAEDVTEDDSLPMLIAKWENTKPIPEPSKEFKDVDGIKNMIDVFFTGHLAKMLHLDNSISETYDDFMKKYDETIKQYSAHKPTDDENENSAALFDAIFGSFKEGGSQ